MAVREHPSAELPPTASEPRAEAGRSSLPQPTRAIAWGSVDVLCLLVLASVGALLATRLNYATHPLEDAAMLMRYAVNLAHGDGMVWNVGGEHVDGATDFLFTVVLSVPIRLGVDAVVATRALVLSAIFLTVRAHLRLAWRVQRGGLIVSLIAASIVILGPELGSPSRFRCALLRSHRGDRVRRSLVVPQSPGERTSRSRFVFACLIDGIGAPGGGHACGPAAARVCLSSVGARRCRSLLVPCLVVTAFGGAYFVWRWNYFGYPLPNPYYKKGGGTFHWDGLRTSVDMAFSSRWPFLLLSGRRLVHRATRSVAVFRTIPFVASLRSGRWCLTK